jgi:hypothetical protein
VLGNVLANDSDADAGDILQVSSCSNVSIDTSNAPADFSGASIAIDSNQSGIACTLTITNNSQSATLTFATNGTVSMSNPTDLFNALNVGEAIVIHATITITDGQAQASGPFSLTINGLA